MEYLANVLVGLTVLIHIGILVVEMLLWRRPTVHRRLGYTQDQADKVAPIVANAGLFNGFLAAGLVWGMVGSVDALSVKTFFLSCIIVAGIYGAATLKWTTLVLQSLPAAAALVVSWVSRS